MFKKIIITKVLVAMALMSGSALAQEQKISIELQLRIVMLSNLAYVNTDMLAAFTKANTPAVHDRATAAIVSAIREKSTQSEADFAAAVGIDVEALQLAEREGTGLDQKVLEKIWGLGLLSVEELIKLRGEAIVADMTDEEKALAMSRAGLVVKEILTILQYIRISTRGDSLQLPPAEGILHKTREDYNILLQLAEEHYPQIKKFISLEAFSDELIASITTASETTDQLRHHVAFMFFQKQISDWRDQQNADKPAS